jgi:hypothetical protein
MEDRETFTCRVSTMISKACFKAQYLLYVPPAHSIQRLYISFLDKINLSYSKTNVQLSLSTPCKNIGGVALKLQPFLPLTLDERVWSTSRSGSFIHGNLCTH